MKIKQLFLILAALFLSWQSFAQCNAAFTFNIGPSGTVYLNATGNNTASTIYQWSYGNGQYGMGQSANVNYNMSGTYNVCLYVIDTLSMCIDSNCMSITAPASQNPCNASFTYTTTGTNLSANFFGTPTANDVFTWTLFDMNGTPTVIGNSATLNYTLTPGVFYTLQLNLSNATTGCLDSTNQFVYVAAPSTCTADFSYTMGANGQVTFSSTSTGTNGATLYNWYEGNNFMGSNPNMTYNFPANGTYVVCLSIMDSTFAGCYDDTCMTIQITNMSGSSNCNASFTYTTNPNGSISFMPTNINTAGTIYTWSSNGNVIATGQNPTVTLPVGTYQICCMTALPGSTCADTVCQSVVVTAPSGCMANFYIYPDSNGAPHSYIGINTSTGNGLSYLWIWGDGTTSTGAYPSHTYPAAGNYQICLVVNGNNCVDTFCIAQTINKTEAMYTVNFYAPNSIKEVKNNTAEIYPNPSHHNFYIGGVEGTDIQIDFVNIHGATVKTIHTKPNQTISCQDISPNIYFLQITNNLGKIYHAKLIKQ